MAGANTLQFDDNNFETEVLSSSQPVLVDFWAEWCGPCRMLAPVIDELAAEYNGKVKIGKVDIDKSSRTATRFGVISIPTVIVFRGGQPVAKMVGIKPKGEYKKVLDPLSAA